MQSYEIYRRATFDRPLRHPLPRVSPSLASITVTRSCARNGDGTPDNDSGKLQTRLRLAQARSTAFLAEKRNRGRTDRSIGRIRPPVIPARRRIAPRGDSAIPHEALTCVNDEASVAMKDDRARFVRRSFRPRVYAATFHVPNWNRAPTSPADIAACVRSRNFLENGGGQRQADGRGPISCRRWRMRCAHGPRSLSKVPSQVRHADHAVSIDISTPLLKKQKKEL